MVHDGAHKLPRSCSTQQSVEVNVANPPENEWVRLPAKPGATKKDNVEQAHYMVRPEVGAMRLGSSDLR